MGNKKFQSTVISLRRLAELAKINYFVIYRRRTGAYKSDIQPNDKTRIANALIKDIAPFLSDLGYDVTIKPLGSPR